MSSLWKTGARCTPRGQSIDCFLGCPQIAARTFFGARDPSSLLTLWNCRLETMAGCAFSTRTGGAPSLALVPQTSVPV